MTSKPASPTEASRDRMVLPGSLLLFSYSPPWVIFLVIFPYRSLLPSWSDTQIPRLLNQRSAFSGSGALTQDSAIFISRSVNGYTGDWDKSSGLSQVWKEIILLSSLHKKLIVLPPPPHCQLFSHTTKMLLFLTHLWGMWSLPLCHLYSELCWSSPLWLLLVGPILAASHHLLTGLSLWSRASMSS